MILVSHRGNLIGPESCTENSPCQIDLAISKNYLVEVDLRIIDDHYWLGHDNPDYKINKEWLVDRSKHLIIHAKNLITCDKLAEDSNTLNWFYHTDEDVVLTSKGWLWAYPGIYLKNAITVLIDKNINIPKNIKGICSDYIELFK